VTIDNSSTLSPLSLPDGTDAVHAGVPSARPDHSVAPATVQTATYAFADTADLERFQSGGDPEPERQEYGRYGNPTTREVERRIAALDGAEDALLFASGMAAVTTSILALVKAGDHVILFRDAYRRTRQFVANILGRFGVEHTLVEPTSIADLKAALRPRTRVAITESPTNPYLRCIDLSAFGAACRAARVKSIVDATFATPFNARPLAHGGDLVIHSATKYLGGHNDVLGGSIAGASSLISLLRDLRSVLGGVADPHAAALIGRGMKTLALRVERQNATALAVARVLEGHPAVTRAYYPGLSSHPDHAIAKEQMRGGGGVVSFEVRGGRAAAARVVDRCRLAIIAPSLGGVETLIEQPAVMSYHELGDEELTAIGIAPGLIRLAVGIEETEAVVGDLRRALDAEIP
jgi:cystathionine gamma-synthase